MSWRYRPAKSWIAPIVPRRVNERFNRIADLTLAQLRAPRIRERAPAPKHFRAKVCRVASASPMGLTRPRHSRSTIGAYDDAGFKSSSLVISLLEFGRFDQMASSNAVNAPPIALGPTCPRRSAAAVDGAGDEDIVLRRQRRSCRSRGFRPHRTRGRQVPSDRTGQRQAKADRSSAETSGRGRPVCRDQRGHLVKCSPDRTLVERARVHRPNGADSR